MEMSHLYHDGSRGGPIVELDVKERLRTKEVNKREQRNLDCMRESVDKAKELCEKSSQWERWRVAQTLHTIWERTPRLERSLAHEKARMESLQHAILSKGFHLTTGGNDSSDGVTSAENLTPSPQRRHRVKRGSRRKGDGEKPLNTNIGVMEKRLQRDKDFTKRSDHVVKALAKLNCRQESRRRDHNKFIEELEEYSKPVIDHARVVLKGRSDIRVEDMLGQLEDYFASQSSKFGSTTTLVSNSQMTQSTPIALNMKLTEGNLLQLDLQHDTKGAHKEEESPIEPVSADQVSIDHLIDQEELVYESRDHDSDQEVESDDDVSIDQNNNIIYRSESSKDNSTHHENSTDSPNVRLPLIVADKTNMVSLKNTNNVPHTSHQSRRKSRQINGNSDPETFRSQSQPLQSSSIPITDTRSTSNSVSKIIIEEDEGDDEFFSPRSNQLGSEQTENTDLTVGDGEHHSEKTGSYMLSSIIGLPQMWRQIATKKKEKPTAEVTAASIARKHRRKRRN